MGQTPVHDLPYPEADDQPDGPVQIKALAEATERELIVHDGQIAALSGVRVGYALNTTTYMNKTGEFILCPVTLPVKASRLYRVDAEWYGSSISVPSYLNCGTCWIKGTAPAVVGRTTIYDDRTPPPIAGWNMPVPSRSMPFSFPEDATVTVWIVTYCYKTAGAETYHIMPSAQGATRPDYCAIYDLGPKP